MQTKLPVHGFVLAGGKSTRMGRDKAMLQFCGKPMIATAVETLRSFCTDVGIAGNRDDLGVYARVIQEERREAGPAAGVEAGLRAAGQAWVLFAPVDVPLLPQQVLRAWAERVISAEVNASVCASYLTSEGHPQPAFCLLRKVCLTLWSDALNGGEHRLLALLRGVHREGSASVEEVAAEDLADAGGYDRVFVPVWFSNVNTPEELAKAEACASHQAGDSQKRTS